MGEKSKEYVKSYAQGISEAARGESYVDERSCLELVADVIYGESDAHKGREQGHKDYKKSK